MSTEKSVLMSLPAAEPVGWYVRTKRTDEERDGNLLGDFGCGHAAGASRSLLAAIASEAINATRETGIGPAEQLRLLKDFATAAKSAVDFCCGNRGHKNFGDHCSQCEPLVRAVHAFEAGR